MSDDKQLPEVKTSTEKAVEQLANLLYSKIGKELPTNLSGLTVEAKKKSLKEALEIFNTHYDFHVGQLVCWKSNMKTRRWPEYGIPAIVLELVDPPLLDDTDNSSSPYFREPLDIKLGILGEDNEFLVYYYDKRRFRPFE